MRRFLENVEWPGRRIQPAEVPAESQETDDEAPARPETPSLNFVSPDGLDEIADHYARTDAVIKEFEGRARDDLNRDLQIDVSDLPGTREAVRIIRGTHPIYGRRGHTGSNVDPETGEERNGPAIGTDDETITADVYIRGMNILDQAGRIAFGFDVSQVADPDFDGRVERGAPITTPEEASGEVDPGTLPGKVGINQAVEERTEQQKLDIWWMMFLAVIAFILRWVANNVILWLARKIRDKLNFKILGKKIPLGDWLSKPYFWLGEWILDIADRLLDQALGQDPDPGVEVPESTPPEPIVNDQDADTSADTLPDPFDNDAERDEYRDSLLNHDVADESGGFPYNKPTGRRDGGSGLPFLTAAVQVVRTVHDAANKSDYGRSPATGGAGVSPETIGREENRPFATGRAVRRHLAARRMRRAYDTYEGIALSMGVPIQDATADDYVVEPEQQVQRGDEQTAFEDCD